MMVRRASDWCQSGAGVYTVIRTYVRVNAFLAWPRNTTASRMARRRPVAINRSATVMAIPERNAKGVEMSGVRVLVGTRKGAFVMTSDEKREKWDINGP